MRESVHELNRIPREFQENGAPEFPELPDEFNRFPRRPKPQKDRSRLRKIMLLLAVAGLVTLGIFAPLLPENNQAEAEAAPTETESPANTPEASVLPTVEPTSAPTTEPTPEPTSEPTPGVDVPYYYRASEVYYAQLRISMPERVSSVSFRLTAPDDEEPALEVELTPQQIGTAVYQLRTEDRDDGFDANAFFAHHEEADLLMELTYTVRGETGEETVTETIEPAVEDWIYWRFDSEDDVGGIGEMMFGDIFPNCFTVRIFDSLNGELNLTVGSDADALGNGDVTISVLIDGREIPAEGSRLLRGMYRYEGDDTIFYDYALVIPLPEDFPQHGTATMTLTRKLTRGEAIIVEVKNVDY